MITRAIRQSMRHSEGQALVLACVMMLVVALAVMATVHLGHGIHERVRLQNTADASAYSSAAAEARAFNYYAFSNRTQASHYVSAMVWHSINSFTYFSEAFLTDAYGLALSLSPCTSPPLLMEPVCTALSLVPYVGTFMQIIDQSLAVVEGAVRIYQQTLEVANPDFFISTAVRLHRTLNQTMMAASTAVMVATLTQVWSMSSGIIEANDPNVSSSLPHRALFGGLSACMLDRAHFREAGGSPAAPMSSFTLDPREVREDSKIARAKRAMAQVANASRFACDTEGDSACAETFVTNRSFSAINPLAFLGPAVRFFEEAVPKKGQTRMLSFRLGKGTNSGVPPNFAGNPNFVDAEANNHIRTYSTPGSHPVGAIAQGDVIGSDDLYWLRPNLPFVHCDRTDDPRYCFGDPRAQSNENYSRMVKTSIWSMSQDDYFPKGVHYRLMKPGRRKNGQFHEKSNIGLNRRDELFGTLAIYAAHVAADPNDQNHEWGGLVPFNHFEPGEFLDKCTPLSIGRGGDPELDRQATRRREFNQPSTFTLLTKSPEALQNPNADPTGATRSGPARLNDEGQLKITLGDSTASLDFDDEVPNLVLGQGMHALARGQSYYHRPGNWAEQPNFFNPYWRPRLAPVLQAREQIPLLQQVINLLPGELGAQPQRFITH